jgi:hypothetical protein
MTPEWMALIDGAPLDDSTWDHLVSGEPTDVRLKPDDRLLLSYRTKVIPGALFEPAYPALVQAAKPTNNRKKAQGDAAELFSNVVGYLNGASVAYLRENPAGWEALQPLLRALNRAFRDTAPDQYAVLQRAAATTDPACLIPFTALTSAAVNCWTPEKNARMFAHRDDGNLAGAFGAMTCLRSGVYQGALLVFPRYRVAVDLSTGDLLIADNQQVHGNTMIRGTAFERLTLIGFYHGSNSPTPER